MSSTKIIEQRDRAQVVSYSIVSIGLFFLFFIISRRNYLLFHTLAELASVLIAWSLFIITWNTRGIVKNKAIVFLGIAYLGVGWLDLLHTLCYKGMGIVGGGIDANPATQLWIAARYMESMALCLFPLSFSRRLPLRGVLGFYLLVTFAVTYFILELSWFPICYVEGVGLTSFKIYSEYIIIALLGCALLLITRQKKQMDRLVYNYLAVSIVLTIVAELAFTLYVDVYGVLNFIGHVVKIASFYFIYRALIKIGLVDPFELFFREINESEQRYRQMFETNRAVKLLVDPDDGSIIEGNEAACSYYGYNKSKLSSLNIRDINMLPPAEVAESMEMARTGEKLVFSFPHMLSNGEVRDVEVYSGPIEYKNKTVLYSIVHDVSERNRIAREKEQHAENLQTIFNSTPNILVLLNEDVRVEMINHKGVSFLEKERAELLGHLGGEVLSCLNAFEGDGCGRNPECSICPVRNTVLSTFETGNCAVDVEGKMTFLIHGQEKTLDLLISTSLITLDGERKVLLSLADISPIRQKEEEVAFHAFLLNQIQDHVTATDLDGKVIYANDAACRALQRSKEDVLGQSVHFFGEEPQQGTTHKEILDSTFKYGEWRGEVVSYTKNRVEVVMDLRTWLIRDSSVVPTCVVGISTDITEQKKIGKQLEQAQKMEVMGTLAGGIAHDFNNILAPILGYTEILLEDTPPEDTAAINSLNHILTSAVRASELVKQILTFARQKNTDYRPLRLQSILKEAVKLVCSTLPKNIEVYSDIDGNCLAVHADATQMHQVIMNLMTNAYHAIGDAEGRIEISYRQVESLPSREMAGNGSQTSFACLTVKDNGSGIPAEVKDKIFDPFFTTKDLGKGTGMGLSVVHGIIKNMDGYITVNSVPGRGAEFNVYLPVEQEAGKQGTERLNKGELPGGSERILLIDDEEPILDMMHRTLEKLGYVVIPRRSPAEALEAFRRSPSKFDLVITDMSMPKMSGDQLALQLLKIRPDVPIILCSGFSEKITTSTPEEMGFREVLMKPVVRRELAWRIRKVLDSGQQV